MLSVCFMSVALLMSNFAAMMHLIPSFIIPFFFAADDTRHEPLCWLCQAQLSTDVQRPASRFDFNGGAYIFDVSTTSRPSSGDQWTKY